MAAWSSLAEIEEFSKQFVLPCQGQLVIVFVFVLDNTLSCFRDYQEIKIQEQVQKLDVGKISSKKLLV